MKHQKKYISCIFPFPDLFPLFQKFPERFYFEGLQDMSTQSQHQYLPIYFGNVCLRFIPIGIIYMAMSIVYTCKYNLPIYSGNVCLIYAKVESILESVKDKIWPWISEFRISIICLKCSEIICYDEILLLPSGVWHCNPPVPRATTCCQISGNFTWPPRGPLQVPW